jgi:hypothetical protein
MPASLSLSSIFKGMAALAVAIAASQSAFAQAPCQPKASLPAVSGTVINVSTEAQLQSAIQNAQANTTVLLAAGTYNLSSTLYIRRGNITLRGDGDTCDKVALVGKGMDNASYGNVPYGVWSDATGLTLTNLTIRDVYYHGVILNSGAQSPVFSSIQILNTGQQHLKSNPTAYGVGVNNGIVKNSRFAYTNGTPTTDHGAGVGYTNGVDVHAGANWVISGNRFENFHTPDSTAWWWNPAILMWNGASGTIAENNVFVNVDRAIAFGLIERGGNVDHSGGVIRNNMVYVAPNLMSANRKADSDAAILVWNSPSTVVAHNTVNTNGNLNKSIEFRFVTTGASAINNLVDAPIGSRNSATFSQSGNLATATSAMFKNPASGDLRLVSTASAAINKVNSTSHAPTDVDGNTRGAAGTVDIGAHEFGVASPPSPPTNIMGAPI